MSQCFITMIQYFLAYIFYIILTKDFSLCNMHKIYDTFFLQPENIQNTDEETASQIQGGIYIK